MGIWLSDERLEQIKELVVNMFIRCDICCVPISGFEIAVKMGVKVMPYSSIQPEKRILLMKKSEDGFSVCIAEGVTIIQFDSLFHESRHKEAV